MNALLPPLATPELRDAYAMLVKGFGKTGSRTAPGPGATVAGIKSASFAQKLCRFCSDPRLREADLIEPLHRAIRREADSRPGVLLAIHDWSTIAFGGHPSKADRATLTHAKDLGYDLATVLIARGDDGSPIAPAVVGLRTADGVLSTRDVPPGGRRPPPTRSATPCEPSTTWAWPKGSRGPKTGGHTRRADWRPFGITWPGPGGGPAGRISSTGDPDRPGSEACRPSVGPGIRLAGGVVG